MWKTLHSSVSDECTKRWKNLVRLFSHYSLAVFMKSSGVLSWDALGDVHVFKPSCCDSLSIQTFFLISLKQYVFLIFSRNKSIPLIKYMHSSSSKVWAIGLRPVILCTPVVLPKKSVVFFSNPNEQLIYILF